MKIPLPLACCILATALGATALAAESVENPIFAKDTKLGLLHTRQAKLNSGLTEGPAAAPDGTIYFTDMPFGKGDGMILRYHPKGGKVTVLTDKSYKSNGLAF